MESRRACYRNTKTMICHFDIDVGIIMVSNEDHWDFIV